MYLKNNREINNLTLKSNIMKALKITLIVTLFIASLTSCTKQDLNEDDVLVAPTAKEYATGGERTD